MQGSTQFLIKWSRYNSVEQLQKMIVFVYPTGQILCEPNLNSIGDIQLNH